MQGKIEKGTDEFMFWQDVFTFRQKYFHPEGNDRYWEEVFVDFCNLNEKYQNTSFGKMAYSISDAIVTDLERKWRVENGKE